MNKIILVWLALISVAVGGVFLTHSAPVQAPQPTPAPGALTGPDIPFNYLKWGAGFGIAQYPVGYPLNQATTTVCSVLSPSATSTIADPLVFREDTSSTTATVLTLATSTNSTASTSPLYFWNIPANTQFSASYVASSTIVAPNTYFNWTQSGGNGTFSQPGSCGMQFNVLPQ